MWTPRQVTHLPLVWDLLLSTIFGELPTVHCGSGCIVHGTHIDYNRLVSPSTKTETVTETIWISPLWQIWGGGIFNLQSRRCKFEVGDM